MRFHSNRFTNGEIFKQYANLMIRDTPLKSTILRFKDYEIRHNILILNDKIIMHITSLVNITCEVFLY